MDFLHNLATGFGVAFTLTNLSYAFVGAFLGTMIGALPGLGSVTAIALLLPFIHAMDAAPALIMLTCVYLGAQHASSTTAALLRSPAKSSVSTGVHEGYPLALEGRAGIALSAVGWGTFFAGLIGIGLIAVLAQPLMRLASGLGSADYFSLMTFGLVSAVVLSSGSIIKAMAMTVLGLLLGQVGPDTFSGVPRYTFGMPELTNDGINFAVIAIGLLGFGKVVNILEQSTEERQGLTRDASGLPPTQQDIHNAWPSVLRGSALGWLFGVLPGSGAPLAAYTTHRLEKYILKNPGEVDSESGKHRVVVGVESARSAAEKTCFIPMLTLALAPNAVMVLLVAAMTVKGLPLGSELMTKNPELVWGLIASMGIGTGVLILLNRPLVSVWINLMAAPYRYVFPAITVLACVGVYSFNNNTFDVLMAAAFAIIGYIFYKLSCELVPLLLGFILGPIMEEHLRRALLMSHGDWSSFISRPLSGTLLVAAALLIVIAMFPTINNLRRQAFKKLA